MNTNVSHTPQACLTYAEQLHARIAVLRDALSAIANNESERIDQREWFAIRASCREALNGGGAR